MTAKEEKEVLELKERHYLELAEVSCNRTQRPLSVYNCMERAPAPGFACITCISLHGSIDPWPLFMLWYRW